MIDCPCGRKNIEDSKCPKCDADLTPLLRLSELPDVYYKDGVKLAGQGQQDKAIEKLVTAISLDCDSIDPYILLGKIYTQKGLYVEAISQYQRVLEIDPENEEAKKAKEDAEKTKAISEKDRARGNYRIATFKKLLIGVPVASFLIGLAVLPISRSLFQQNPAENNNDVGIVVVEEAPPPVIEKFEEENLEVNPSSIVEKIRQNIAGYSNLADLEIDVTHKDNVFVVSGEVPTDIHIDLITEIASKLVDKTQLDLSHLKKQEQDVVLMAAMTEGNIAHTNQDLSESNNEGKDKNVEISIPEEVVPVVNETKEGNNKVNYSEMAEQITKNIADYSDLSGLKIYITHNDNGIVISGEMPTKLHKDLIIVLSKNITGTIPVDVQNLSITPYSERFIPKRSYRPNTKRYWRSNMRMKRLRKQRKLQERREIYQKEVELKKSTG